MHDKQIYDSLDNFMQCSFCNKHFAYQEITFQCLDCKKCILCADCLIAAVPVVKHLKVHRFFPVCNHPDIVFADGICLSDSLYLFTLIQTMGLNNWDRVRSILGKSYSDELLCKHILTFCDNQNGILQTLQQKTENVGIKYIQELFSKQNIKQTIDISQLRQLKNYIPLYSLHVDPADSQDVSEIKQIIQQPQKRSSQNISLGSAEQPYMIGIETTISFLHFSRKGFIETRESLQFKIQILQCFVSRLKMQKQLSEALQFQERQNDQTVKQEAQTSRNAQIQFLLNKYQKQDINLQNLTSLHLRWQKERDLRIEIFKIQAQMQQQCGFSNKLSCHNNVQQNGQQNSLQESDYGISQYLICYNQKVQDLALKASILISKVNHQHAQPYTPQKLITNFIIPILTIYQCGNQNANSGAQIHNCKVCGDRAMIQSILCIFCLELLLKFEQNICKNTFKLLYDQDLLTGIEITTNQLHRIVTWQEQLYEIVTKTDIQKLESSIIQSGSCLSFINQNFHGQPTKYAVQVNSKYQIRLIRQLIIAAFLQSERDLDGYIQYFQCSERLKKLVKDIRTYGIFYQKYNEAKVIFGKLPDIETQDNTNIRKYKNTAYSANKQQGQSNSQFNEFGIKNNDKKQVKTKQPIYNIQPVKQQNKDTPSAQENTKQYKFFLIINEINRLGQELQLQKIHADLQKLSVDEGLSIQGARNLTMKSILQYSQNKRAPKCSDEVLDMLNSKNSKRQFRCQFNVKQFKIKQQLTIFDVMICALCSLNHNYFIQIKSFAAHRNWDVGSGLIHFLGGRTLLAEFLSYVWSQQYKTETSHPKWCKKTLSYESEIISTFFADTVSVQLHYMGAPVMQKQIVRRSLEDSGQESGPPNTQNFLDADPKQGKAKAQPCQFQQPDQYLISTVVAYKQQIADSLLNKLRQILCP